MLTSPRGTDAPALAAPANPTFRTPPIAAKAASAAIPANRKLSKAILISDAIRAPSRVFRSQPDLTPALSRSRSAQSRMYQRPIQTEIGPPSLPDAPTCFTGSFEQYAYQLDPS